MGDVFPGVLLIGAGKGDHGTGNAFREGLMRSRSLRDDWLEGIPHSFANSTKGSSTLSPVTLWRAKE